MTDLRSTVESNYRRINDTIRRIAEESGRDPDAISLIAVTKGFDVDILELAASLDLNSVGENRVKTAIEKKDSLSDSLSSRLEWHMIGHVQSNKVKHLLGEFDWIHSLDRESLVEELDKRLSRNDLSQTVLMQVNTSGEESKYGALPDDAVELFENILDRSTLDVQGLMTMAPYTEETETLRETFARCRKLRDRLEERFNVDLPELSMGMTNDYPQAIREGATMLRIGRGLFGERPE